MMNASADEFAFPEVNVVYTLLEVVIAVCAVIFNSLILYVFARDRHMKKKTNYYLASLAAADLLVGLLGIPFAIFASIGLPANLYACLFNLSVLLSICTVSILSLVTVCVDRYCMIVYPTSKYAVSKDRNIPLIVIGVVWFTGSLIGCLPLMGWYTGPLPHSACYFKDLIDPNYLVFIFFSTTVLPAVLLLAAYSHIYLVVTRQARVVHEMTLSNHPRPRSSLEIQRREVKMTQQLVVIVVFFVICWVPIHLHNCLRALCPNCTQVPLTVIEAFIIISHLHSAINPVLYAFHLRDFRRALSNVLPSCVLGNVRKSTPPTSAT